MEKLDFLLGHWDLEYYIPKSAFSEKETTGTGTGTFQRSLEDQYLFFDYSTLIDNKAGQAHAVFARDNKNGIYRLWWFESSGNFNTATGNLINNDTLFLHWQDSLLIQTFTRKNADLVILKMENPNAKGDYEVIMKVIFRKK